MVKVKIFLPVFAFLVIVVFAIILGLEFGLRKKKKIHQKKNYYENGAVATDALKCSEIGRDVLIEGGHAVDAAIASLLCTGIVNLHSTGISGGGFMSVYNRKLKQSFVYNYREAAPGSLRADAFDKNVTLKNVVMLRYLKNIYGCGLAVGVPGELRGLHKAHQKFGKLNWKRLVTPSIELAEKGFSMGNHMYKNMIDIETKKYLELDPGYREILINKNGLWKKEGEIIVLKKLAETLRKVRDDPDALYTGELSQGFINDVVAHNGNMTLSDLESYEVKEETPIEMKLGNYTLYTTPLPGGGTVLLSILKILKGFNWTKEDFTTFDKKVLNYHRMVEAFKFSYATRPFLGDPDKNPSVNRTAFNKLIADILDDNHAEQKRLKINDSVTRENKFYSKFFTNTQDSGTTHVSVIDKEGNAVSATDTINYAFGAKFCSVTSGICFNNELADFFIKSNVIENYPTTAANFPGPGKRPLSSTCPTIIVNNEGNVVMIVGGSGGTKITLSTAWVIMKVLWLGYSLEDAINDVRVYHTFSPSYIQSETTSNFKIPINLMEGLKKKGHKFKDSTRHSVIQGIYVKDGKIYAKSDPRKQGEAAGY
ncbi:glutathione hydrolase 1 proenzyme isoform X1 [Hydra vulgaris]|uniref:glutathione hydrolase 1 proenzyme isoform X1 n=1 Tax=Hydra vulgaris TaxID=6087 RepID=UPI0032EA0042